MQAIHQPATKHIERAQQFRALHQQSNPLQLYNIWDVGSAKIIAEAGASAIATGSWSVAAAQGYADGEQLPFELLVQIVERITNSVNLPVTVDFEAGYAESIDMLQANLQRLLEAGIVGINFEDGLPGTDRMRATEDQQVRIASLRKTADEYGVPLFINARTDLFMPPGQQLDKHAERVAEAIGRAQAYKQAGADGLFVPGLVDAELIKQVVDAVALPVNVMGLPSAPDRQKLTEIGVARISYGPLPYWRYTKFLQEDYRRLLQE